jgi:hypothetical protein
MKKIYIIISILFFNFISVAQIRTIGGSPTLVSTSSAFLDASSSSTYDATTNSAKGIAFPRVDLTTFTFLGVTGSSSSFRNRYDGFIVYNTATSGVALAGSTTGTLSRGFWYYNNSAAGVGAGTTTGGTWTPLASGSLTKDVTSTEIALSTKINGAQLYAINGTFTASGTSPSVSVTVPSGMTGYYSLITYQNGKTFRREIYSFDTASSTNNVICGNGIYSEVLPAGTYNYVLEYFK